MDKNDRVFKGIWIPAELWLNEELNRIDIILLSEITSLDKGLGCSASNKYLSKFMKLSENKVSQHIKKLKDLGYIEETKFNGRQRFLKIIPKTNNQEKNIKNNKLGSIYQSVQSDFTKVCSQTLPKCDTYNNSIYNIKELIYNIKDLIIADKKNALSALIEIGFLDKEQPKKKSKTVKQYDTNSWEYKLAKFFFDEIEKHDAGFPQPNLNQWAGELSKLVYVEKLDIKEIEKVIMFATADKFWSSVIIKPYSLRVKYQQLRKQMLSNQKPKRLGIENIDLSDVPMTGYLDPNRKKRTF
jgi:DNA-binding Lrp family transcriptional regulator